jgi:flagellar hook-associated protein 3 FlgL
MQISTKQFFASQLASMADSQSKIGRLQQEISTGKKLLQPSDDPSAYAKVSALKQSEASSIQYDRNISVAKQRLSQEENALSEACNAAIRLRELSIAGASDTYGPSDRQTIATEMRQVSEQLASVANITDSNGDYLFSGFQSKVKPFVLDEHGVIQFNGDSGRREIEIAKGVRTASSSSGAEIFMQVRLPNGQKSESIFDIVKDAADALEAGESSKDYVDKMKAALNHFTVYQTIAGSRLQKVESVQQLGENSVASGKIMRAGMEDANIEQLATDMQHSLLLLNASQTTFSRISQLSLFNYMK